MSTEYASVDDLVAVVEPETRDVELPNGKTVKVRGLTRFELIVHGKGTEDGALIERRNVAACLVEPRMTEKQVETWQKSPGSISSFGLVSEAIRDLSGLGEGAGKSDVAEVRD